MNKVHYSGNLYTPSGIGDGLTLIKDSNIIVLLVAELVVVTVALQHILKKVFIS